jgi:hypothetical protein
MNLYGPRQLVDGMRTVRKNTILIAEDIPENGYAYRPTPDSRSVAETLVHIAMLGRADRFLHEEDRRPSLEGFDFGELISRSQTEEKRLRSKSEIVELLRSEGERAAQWVEVLPETLLADQVRQRGGASQSRFEMLLGS